MELFLGLAYLPLRLVTHHRLPPITRPVQGGEEKEEEKEVEVE